jgi:hypothetical protein
LVIFISISKKGLLDSGSFYEVRSMIFSILC